MKPIHWAAIMIGLAVITGCSSLFTDRNQAAEEGEGSQTPDENTIVERPGYENLANSIGDPAPLVQKSGGKAITYQGEPMLQACEMLTLADLQEAGFLLDPNPLAGGIMRSYFDGKGEAAFSSPSEWSLPMFDESNQCSYGLYTEQKESAPNEGEVENAIDTGSEARDPGGKFILVTVYQPPYVSGNAVQYVLDRRYKKDSESDGVTIYTEKENRSGQIRSFLVGDRVAVEIAFKLGLEGESAKEAFIQTVAKRMGEAVANPSGPPQFEYDSPTFTKAYGNGCKWTGNDEMRSLFGVDATPLVTERVGTAVGVITFTRSGDDTLYNYIDHSCSRYSSGGISERKSLNIHTTTYESEKPAQLDFAFGKEMTREAKPLDEAVGDETYFQEEIAGNKFLVFRKGRAVVKLSIHDKTNPDLSDAEKIERLVPVAQGIAEQMEKDGF